MMRVTVLLAILSLATNAFAQTTPAAPPAPPPGSAATYKSAESLAAALKAAKPTAGGMTTSAVSITDQYRVNIVKRAQAAGAVAHPGNTELHYIIEGSGTIVTGGRIAGGANGTSATIEGGVAQRVKPGDVVVVPAGSAHWYSTIDGASITYLEVRWLAPK